MPFHSNKNSLGDIVELSFDEIYIFDLETLRFKYINASGLKNLGYTAEDIIELTPVDIKPEFSEEIFREMIVPIKLEDGKSINFETIHQRKDNTTYNVEVHLQSINYEGEIVACAIILDISKRIMAEKSRLLAEQQLQQTKRLENLGVLAAEVAHDFNNLLASMMGYASLIFDRTSSGSTARLHVTALIEDIERGAALTNKMLAFSGNSKLDIQAVNLEVLIESLAHLIELSLPRDASIEYDLSLDSTSLHADTAQVQQLILALMSNAAEAIDVSGKIKVSTILQSCDDSELAKLHSHGKLFPGDYVILTVKDNGVGIDPENLNRVFDPFYTTKPKNSGLGLTAALGIVGGHQGGINIYSEPGSGSSVMVYFPSYGERLT